MDSALRIFFPLLCFDSCVRQSWEEPNSKSKCSQEENISGIVSFGHIKKGGKVLEETLALERQHWCLVLFR